MHGFLQGHLGILSCLDNIDEMADLEQGLCFSFFKSVFSVPSLNVFSSIAQTIVAPVHLGQMDDGEKPKQNLQLGQKAFA